MSLEVCNTCNEEISKDAKSCPHCGQKNPLRKVTAWEDLAILILAIALSYFIISGDGIFILVGFALFFVGKHGYQTLKHKFKIADLPAMHLLLVLVGGIFLLGAFMPQSSYEISKDQNRKAYYMCKHFIKEELNDPGSLDFPDSNTAHITSNGNTYDIAGTFRANNAFGAKVQSSYACTVTEKPSEDTWTLDYLSEF